MFTSNDGYTIGADLVRDVTVGGNPVSTHDDLLNRTVPHEVSGHVVGYQGAVDASLHQLPCGQAGSLEEWSRLIDEHMEPDPRAVRKEDGCQCSSPRPSRQRTGIAVGQNPITGGKERHPVGTDGVA